MKQRVELGNNFPLESRQVGSSDVKYRFDKNLKWESPLTGKKSDTLKMKDIEKAMGQLEKIVEDLESGELSLEKSIDKFESGVELYKNCRSLLDQAEKKINKLTESLKEVPLEE